MEPIMGHLVGTKPLIERGRVTDRQDDLKKIGNLSYLWLSADSAVDLDC